MVFFSPNGGIALSAASPLVLLGRAFVDFYDVYGKFGIGLGAVTLATQATVALFGGWVWGLLAAVEGSRRGLAAL